MKPAQAPPTMHPSAPRLITPARSAITSPRVAYSTAVLERTAPADTSCTKLMTSRSHARGAAPAGEHREQHQRHQDVDGRAGQVRTELERVAAHGDGAEQQAGQHRPHRTVPAKPAR